MYISAQHACMYVVLPTADTRPGCELQGMQLQNFGLKLWRMERLPLLRLWI